MQLQLQAGTPLSTAQPASPEPARGGGLFSRVSSRHRRNSSSQQSLVSLSSIGRTDSLGGAETPVRRASLLPFCLVISLLYARVSAGHSTYDVGDAKTARCEPPPPPLDCTKPGTSSMCF